MGRRRRRAVHDTAQLLGVGEKLTDKQCDEEDDELNELHDRDSARSSGPLSRKSSGWPMYSFPTGRRLARSLSTLSMPLSGTLGAGLNNRPNASTDLLT